MKICLPGEKVKSNSAIFTVGRIFLLCVGNTWFCKQVGHKKFCTKFVNCALL